MSEPHPSTIANDGIPRNLDPLASLLERDDPQFRPAKVAGELGVLAGYRVQKLLGRGGMGSVYLGYDEMLQRQIALKVMLPKAAADPESYQRFTREARAIAAVKHDNVVAVYQVSEDCGVPVIAMVYLKGYPLDEYLRRKGRLTIEQALRVGTETAAGLAAAHAQGLIHRDIKPGNLWLEAPHGRIKILDFGLAKSVDTADGQSRELTRTGIVVGTPAYMSPEQARGETVDARSDLFSLGIVLYQLTTGTRPFDRSTAVSSLLALTTEEAPSVRDRNPEVPESFANLIHWLLVKDCNKRPQTAMEVTKLLRSIAHGKSIPDPRELTVLPTIAQPQVVYVPIQVTAYEPMPNAFANLADGSAVGSTEQPKVTKATDTPAEKSSPPKKGKNAPRNKSNLSAWALPAVAVLGAAIIVAVVYTSMNRKPAPEVVEQPNPDKKNEPPKVKVDPLRRPCEWILSVGGQIELENGQTIRDKADLPRTPLVVTGVSFSAIPYHVTNEDIDNLKGFTDLTTLHFFAHNYITDVGVAKIATLPCAPKLTVLSLRLTNATEKSAPQLAKFPNLTYLFVSNINLRNQCSVFLQLPKLNRLNIPGTSITDDDIATLSQLKVVTLSLPQCPAVTGKGFEEITRMKTTSELYIGETGIRATDLKLLAKMPQITHLEITGLQLQDADLEALKVLPNLGALFLTKNPLTDNALDYLEHCKHISQLLLHNTAITDKSLERLAQREKLVYLGVLNTKVTDAGVKKFRAAKPKCKFEE